MTYKLAFHQDALSEWRRLDPSVRDVFKKKLAERLANPRVPSAKLSGHPDRYKIKQKRIGYRLVYEVHDTEVVVVVVAVSRREHNAVHGAAAKRS
jgi:mRNA interferase RelE/StbE